MEPLIFLKIDKHTGEETVISSEEMVQILESDLKSADIDEALTEIVIGSYNHQNRSSTFRYRP